MRSPNSAQSLRFLALLSTLWPMRPFRLAAAELLQDLAEDSPSALRCRLFLLELADDEKASPSRENGQSPPVGLLRCRDPQVGEEPLFILLGMVDGAHPKTMLRV